MKVFELHFNPGKNRDSVFDSFVYEPENSQEEYLGSLYAAGELTKAFPQNKGFLDDLANVIKNGFYGKTNLSDALKGANNFLDEEAKSGNVNWLGNLNFAIINIKDSILNFTKVGSIRILLLREGEALDISQNLELQDQEPYPLKVFSNIASGKLSAQDKILIVTQEIFSIISGNGAFLNQLGQVTKEDEFKNIFKEDKDALSEISGICLLITEGNTPSTIKTPGMKFIPKRISKRAVLIATLILVLTVGFFLFKDVQKEQSNQAQGKIEEARSKIMMAENFIIIKKEEKAQALFQEAWDILLPIKTKEAASLRESIKKYLK